MGVTIHYKGRIASTTTRDQLIEELEDICSSMQWKVNRIEQSSESDPPLNGIVFNPHPECDLVSFIFDNEGWLCSPVALQYYEPDNPNQRIVSVKTQFSSPDIHIVIIKVLRYIKQKFVPNLQVTDEGEYWDTEDKERLQELFKFVNDKLDRLASQLVADNKHLHKAALTGQLIERLEKLLRQYLGDVKVTVVHRSEKSDGPDLDSINLN